MSASLDRIDSNRGYCDGNIQWVHKYVNRIKQNFDEKLFVEICRLVAARAGAEAISLITQSDLIDLVSQKAIERDMAAIDPFSSHHEDVFSESISLMEIVDKLSITNIKLFKLKDLVIQRSSDAKFCSDAAVKDVALCEERSRLKNLIDAKMLLEAKRRRGDLSVGFIPEVKSYG